MDLLPCFVKGTRRTPRADLEIARTRQREVMRMSESNIGTSFDDFLDAEGIRDEVDALAQKRVFVWQIERAMEASGITKVEMAERMNTSRSQLDRLLDPDNDRVQLDTLQRAARAVGGKLRLELA